jgi:amino acid adenylation domain-containing protein
MTLPPTLPGLLSAAARHRPDGVAIEESPGVTITYSELAQLADRVAGRLAQLGTARGDRVGVYLPKSIDAVATIYGVMKAGAAYVPVDPEAPVARGAFILNDCSVKVVIVDDSVADGWMAEAQQLGHCPQVIRVRDARGGQGIRAALGSVAGSGDARGDVVPSGDDLAYILYTSGSTGRPKGVMLTHSNAVSFVDWCAQTLGPREEDRFSSHAPFHFDLSILDLYVPVTACATLVLIDSATGKEPGRLAELIADRRLSVWYSTPSVLSLLAQFGKLERHDVSALRIVLFAGEVFPIKHLRRVKQLIPKARYLNLYGPTETNVCTWFEIPTTIESSRTEPYPIGRACGHVEAVAIDAEEHEIADGGEGELCIRGASVMQGYWNLDEANERAFATLNDGQQWYRTGDMVIDVGDGVYVFVGRRDRMVKKRGYRIELDEIEAALYRHPDVTEAAVVAVADADAAVRTHAFLRCSERPSVIKLKRFCTEHLPAYMVPDRFSFCDTLPKTSTDKIDYQALTALAGAP